MAVWLGYTRKGERRIALLSMAVVIMVLLAACSRPGVQVNYAVRGESILPEDAQEKAEHTAAPQNGSPAGTETTPSSPPVIAATPPPAWGTEPFDRVGFALDPYGEDSAEKGRIFAALPDGSSVRVQLHYLSADRTAETQTQYAKVKGQKLDYAFLLPPLAPQFVKLSALWQPQEEAQPQPENVIALFGEKGEKLPMPPSTMGAYGQQVLQESWALAYPDAEAAEGAVLDALQAELGEVEARWHQGVLCVTISGYAAAINPAERQEMLAAAEAAALAYYPFGEGDFQPGARVLDRAGATLASGGKPVEGAAMDIVEAFGEAVFVAGGERYHVEGCRYASGARKTARFVAELEGYTACRICLKE